MLDINLATRPFYNARAVALALGSVALAATGVLVMEVLLLGDISREREVLVAAAARHEAAAQSAAASSAETLRRVAAAQPAALAAAATEANALIDRRLFSWTALFNELERTLPSGVMLVSVQPDVGAGGASLALEVIGRSVPDIGAFIDALEATGAFSGVLARDEEALIDGGFRTHLVARYAPLPAAGAAEPTEPAPQ